MFFDHIAPKELRSSSDDYYLIQIKFVYISEPMSVGWRGMLFTEGDRFTSIEPLFETNKIVDESFEERVYPMSGC